MKAIRKPIVATLAATTATLGVLTNPFREERKSFSRRYHHTMKWNADPDLYTEVNACPNCHRPIDHKMFRAGQTEYGYLTGNFIVHQVDTHCPEHWDRVRAYQNHYQHC